MKNYKDFEKVHIGSSDIASLTLRTWDDVCILPFDANACYTAYECFGDVEIGEHYHKVFDGTSWLKIYDDWGLCYYEGVNYSYTKVTVYRSGLTDCIIHWHD